MDGSPYRRLATGPWLRHGGTEVRAPIGSVVAVHTSGGGDGSVQGVDTVNRTCTRTRTRNHTRTRTRTGGRRGDGAADLDRQWRMELTVGLIGVAAVALEGLLVAHRSVAGALDRWLQDVVPGSHAAGYVDVTWFRYPWVVVIGAVVLAAVSLRRDPLRAIACLVGPPLAVVLGQEVIKPMVGRTLGGSLTYPSGSTTGAAALAVAAILAVPPRWKWVTAVVAVGYALWMTIAVVALRWHFPTDSLGGSVLGVAVVLVVDAVSHLVGGRILSRRRRRRGRGVEASPT
jgi:membrane-associated phospholipid phosphatase